MIADHDDVYHVPMTCMICGKIHKTDFSTLIVCGTVHVCTYNTCTCILYMLYMYVQYTCIIADSLSGNKLQSLHSCMSIQVQAVTRVGAGNFSETVLVVMGQSSESSSSSPVVPVTVAVIVVVIVVLSAIAAVLLVYIFW